MSSPHITLRAGRPEICEIYLSGRTFISPENYDRRPVEMELPFRIRFNIRNRCQESVRSFLRHNNFQVINDRVDSLMYPLW